MIKTMTINLGGQDRSLKFGTMGFLKFVQEASGADPLKVMTSTRDQYQFIFSYIYAALRCAGCQETKEVIDNWVQDLSVDIGIGLVETATECMEGEKKPGEAQSQVPEMKAAV